MKNCEKQRPFRVNDEISTNYGDCIVVEYIHKKRIKVRFTSTGYETWAAANHLRTGNVKDWLSPTVYGVGVIGRGEYKVTENGYKSKEYQIWSDMLKRCYDPATLNKNPAYIDVFISNELLNYQNFARWCNNQIGFGLEGWQLDKDIILKGNKIYCTDLCAFVPRDINVLFTKRKRLRGDYPIGVYKNIYGKYTASVSDTTGESLYLGGYSTVSEAFEAYKEAKEDVIKSVAEKWKDKIDTRVYEAMLKYKVEITD